MPYTDDELYLTYIMYTILDAWNSREISHAISVSFKKQPQNVNIVHIRVERNYEN